MIAATGKAQLSPGFAVRIREDTADLSLPGGRRVGSPGHEEALLHLERRMEEMGLRPFSGTGYRLAHEYGGRKFVNLAGVVPGSRKDLRPVLTGAHYDSAIDGPSSDDNAAAVAVLLAACESLVKRTPQRSVIAVFFDAEEKPFFGTEAMGSARFVRDHCGGLELSAAVILDAIGHDFEIMVPALDRTLKRIREFIFVLGHESHHLFPEVVEKASEKVSGIRVVPTLNRYIGDSSDYMAFRKAGYPWLFLSRGNGRFTHTMKDDMNWVNFQAAEKVLRLLLEILRGLDRAELEEDFPPRDTAAFEIRMLRKAAGLLLPAMLLYLRQGKPWLCDRNDLDRLAVHLKRSVRL